MPVYYINYLARNMLEWPAGDEKTIPVTESLEFVQIYGQIPDMGRLYEAFLQVLNTQIELHPAHLLSVKNEHGSDINYLLLLNPSSFSPGRTDHKKIALINWAKMLCEENSTRILFDSVKRGIETLFPVPDYNALRLDERQRHALATKVSSPGLFMQILKGQISKGWSNTDQIVTALNVYLQTVEAAWIERERIIADTNSLEPEPMSALERTLTCFYFLDNVRIEFKYTKDYLRNIAVQKHIAIYVLGELVANAVKYGNRFVDVVIDETDTDYVIRVGDKGCGISPDEMENIFKMRYRSPCTAGSAKGNGEGLTYVLDTVIKHNGRVELFSKNPNNIHTINSFSVVPGADGQRRQTLQRDVPTSRVEEVMKIMSIDGFPDSIFSTVFQVSIPKNRFS